MYSKLKEISSFGDIVHRMESLFSAASIFNVFSTGIQLSVGMEILGKYILT